MLHNGSHGGAPDFGKLDTIAIHGARGPRTNGAAVLPVHNSVTYGFSGDVKDGKWGYTRPADTPNHSALAAKMALLEGTEDAVVSSSGMAAISSTLMTLLRPGDHLIIQANVYGGTHELVHFEFPVLGIKHTLIDPMDPSKWEDALRPNTKVFYVESMSNPLIQVADLARVAEFCSKHNLTPVVDNTFASPVLCTPARYGFIVIHSATKFLNGHSDLLAGVVSGPHEFIEKEFASLVLCALACYGFIVIYSATKSLNGPSDLLAGVLSGPHESIDGVKEKMVMYGGCLDPHACFLLNRGMQTLGLRVRKQCESALAIAQMLEEHPMVGSINYPGLASSPEHSVAMKLFGGRAGGVLSFVLKGSSELTKSFLGHLHLPFVAPSLGGVESLVTMPAETSHLALGLEGRKVAGIPETLVRLSVGIEDTDDLIQDIQRALDAVSTKKSSQSNGIGST